MAKRSHSGLMMLESSVQGIILLLWILGLCQCCSICSIRCTTEIHTHSVTQTEYQATTNRGGSKPELVRLAPSCVRHMTTNLSVRLTTNLSWNFGWPESLTSQRCPSTVPSAPTDSVILRPDANSDSEDRLAREEKAGPASDLHGTSSGLQTAEWLIGDQCKTGGQTALVTSY